MRPNEVEGAVRARRLGILTPLILFLPRFARPHFPPFFAGITFSTFVCLCKCQGLTCNYTFHDAVPTPQFVSLFRAAIKVRTKGGLFPRCVEVNPYFHFAGVLLNALLLRADPRLLQDAVLPRCVLLSERAPSDRRRPLLAHWGLRCSLRYGLGPRYCTFQGENGERGVRQHQNAPTEVMTDVPTPSASLVIVPASLD